MVALTGPLATANYEPRQARKGATVVVTLCAEVWLVRVTAITPDYLTAGLAVFILLLIFQHLGHRRITLIIHQFYHRSFRH